MDSRERTFRALSFEEPDRVPIDVWMSSGFQRKLEATLGQSAREFLDRYDVDLRYIEGPRYIGPQLRSYPDGSADDVWGVRRKPVTVQVGDTTDRKHYVNTPPANRGASPRSGDTGQETYWEVLQSPLAWATTVEEIEAYPYWPSPDWFDYSEISAQCEDLRDERRVLVFQGDRLNRIAQLKPAMYLRGIERVLLDTRENPGVLDAIIRRIRTFYLVYAERIFDAAGGKLDILLTGDDFGSQHGPLVSPSMWVRFLGAGFRAYSALAKSYGVRVMHHTCGSVRPLIPLLIERGLEILQSLQPEADDMDGATLKGEFGNRLAFHGGISIQQTLPFGTPDEVRREVAKTVRALAPGGGYILCTSHNLQADVPVRNAVALLDAYHEFGRYS